MASPRLPRRHHAPDAWPTPTAAPGYSIRKWASRGVSSTASRVELAARQLEHAPALVIAIFYLYARIGLVGTSFGLVLGHTVLAVPFVVVTVMAVLKNYDERLDQAASTLGASKARTLWHITFPLIQPGLIAAYLFAFVTSFDELTIALFVSGGTATTLPKQMWTDALLKVSPTVLAASTVVLFFVTCMILLAERIRRRTGG